MQSDSRTSYGVSKYFGVENNSKARAAITDILELAFLARNEKSLGFAYKRRDASYGRLLRKHVAKTPFGQIVLASSGLSLMQDYLRDKGYGSCLSTSFSANEGQAQVVQNVRYKSLSDRVADLVFTKDYWSPSETVRQLCVPRKKLSNAIRDGLLKQNCLYGFSSHDIAVLFL